MLEHLHQADPASVRSAALASKTMHAGIRASGMLKAESLIHLAKNAWQEEATAPTVLEEVIAAAKDQAIPLTSKQRLGIIKETLKKASRFGEIPASQESNG